VLSGLRPAVRLSARDIVGDLKESGGGVVRWTRRRRRLVPRGLSVVFQIALSVALVMIATLFTRTAWRATRADPGFGLAGKVVVRIDSRAGGYTRAQAAAACEVLAQRLRGMPVIAAVGLSTSFPVGDSREGMSQRVTSTNRDASRFQNLAPGDRTSEVNGRYFEAMEIPLLQGRRFSPRQRPRGPAVVIDEYWPAPGRTATLWVAYPAWLVRRIELCQVVGIVPNLRALSGEPSDRSHIYEPFRPEHVPLYVHLRLAGTAPRAERAVVQSIGAQIRRLDPRLPVVSVLSLTDQHRNGMMVRQMGVAAKLATLFGTMALFLAGLGLTRSRATWSPRGLPRSGFAWPWSHRRNVLVMFFSQGSSRHWLSIGARGGGLLR
jgi:hypothetical protein